MSKQRKRKKNEKNLSGQTIAWMLFNLASIINFIIQLFSNLSGIVPQNSPIVHFIYNMTSIFLIIPFYIIMPINFLVFGQDAYQYIDPAYSRIVIAAFILSFLTNYLISRILFTKKLQNLYRPFIKKHRFLTWGIVFIVIFLFATG